MINPCEGRETEPLSVEGLSEEEREKQTTALMKRRDLNIAVDLGKTNWAEQQKRVWGCYLLFD